MTKQKTVDVTYQGPGGAYRVPNFEGTEYVLVTGRPTPVPDGLAKRLAKTKGHSFTVAAAEAPGGDGKGEQGSTQAGSTVGSD